MSQQEPLVEYASFADWMLGRGKYVPREGEETRPQNSAVEICVNKNGLYYMRDEMK